MPVTTRLVLVMGPAGAGKTSVGSALAAALGARFVDSDDYHSDAEIERMRGGTPLDDAARWPWLRRTRAAVLPLLADGPVVLACSALKSSYRDLLLDGMPGAVVVLLAADRDELARRLRDRPDHFMPASLVDSQLADLEPPPGALVIDATLGPERAVAAILGEITPPRTPRGRAP